jgi:pimeloyl-ACP methyl ester carboxylesterase
MSSQFAIRAKTWPSIFAAFVMFAGCDQEISNPVKSADDIPIYYDAYGEENTTLVFVHGWSCDRTYWTAQLEPFSEKYRVVTIDLAGHGQSGGDRKKWTIESFGDDVAVVVRELDLKEVVLIGHSMGGDVIVDAATKLPGRVKGLIWIDTYKQLGTPRTAEQVTNFIEPFRTDFKTKAYSFVKGMFTETADSTLVERVATDMSSAPTDVAIASMEAAITYDAKVTGNLEKLRLPVMAINPDNSPTDTTSLKRYGVLVTTMPGVGHFPMMEEPSRFNEILLETVESIIKRNK